MKGVRLSHYCLWPLLAALLCSAFTACGQSGETFTAREKCFLIEDLEIVTVEADFANITIRQEDGDSLLLRYSDSTEEHYTFTEGDESLYISRSSARTSGTLNVPSENAALEIILPDSFSGNLTVSTAVGDICVESLRLSDVVLRADVGNIELTSLSLETLDAKVGTGEVTLQSLEAETSIQAEVALGKLKCFFPSVLSSTYQINATAKDGTVTSPAGSTSADRTLTLSCDMGDIYVFFRD